MIPAVNCGIGTCAANRPGSIVIVLIVLLLVGCGSSNYAPVQDGTPGGLRGHEGVVVAGDTLYAIAWRYGVDYRDVARWNNLKPPYIVRPGQRLRLTPPPGGQGGGAVGTTTASSGRTTSGSAPRQSPSQKRQAETAAQSSKRRSSAGAGANSDRTWGVAKAPASANSQDAGKWQWPLRGKVVRSFQDGKPGAAGIDIAASDGASVRAAADGRVVYKGSGLPGYGRLIIIKHTQALLSAYGYLGETNVKEGDSVRRGQTIAKVGTGGGYRSPVLHFEIRHDGHSRDPLQYLPG